MGDAIQRAERSAHIIDPDAKVDPDPVFVEVAVPRPLHKLFVYRVPAEWRQQLRVGARVKVPFGRNTIRGFIVNEIRELSKTSCTDEKKIRDLEEIGDATTDIPDDVYRLCEWISKYYHAPLGEVLHLAQPVTVNKKSRRRAKHAPPSPPPLIVPLSDEQAKAVDAIWNSDKLVALLDGVTGSGKTEVYLELARRTLQSGGAVLFVVPEISMVPLMHQRVERALGERIAIWHSALPDGERSHFYQGMRSGQYRVAIGARSAVLCPLKNLKLILIDEEHDGSYKQDERVRYHARDVALMRARHSGARCVLGSATPSLETLEKVREGKFGVAQLPTRPGEIRKPEIQVIDLLKSPLVPEIRTLFAQETLQKIKDTLARDEQVIIYLNRRGYAQFLLCEDCRHVWRCDQCSISLAYYAKSGKLQCHVCGKKSTAPDHCPKCVSRSIVPVGSGTECLTEEIETLLPQAKIDRLDRDQVTSHTRLLKVLENFKSGKTHLLVGTQMIVKGHDFPRVTLVVVVLADQLFEIPDFRAPERAWQTLTQVSGRSGRSELPGTVLIQTTQPEHPVLDILRGKMSREKFLETERQLRETLLYPPFGRLARLRFEDAQSEIALGRSNQVASFLRKQFEARGEELSLLGPSEAALARSFGKYRFDITLRSRSASLIYQAICEARKTELEFVADVDTTTV